MGWDPTIDSEYKDNEIDNADGLGKRGVLIFTGATGSLRGGPMTSIFSAGKGAMRALSQSLAKEFGKENIHVAHVSKVVAGDLFIVVL